MLFQFQDGAIISTTPAAAPVALQEFQFQDGAIIRGERGLV